MTKTIYLANPYGFSEQQRSVLLPQIVAALEELGLEVWEPFAKPESTEGGRRVSVLKRQEGAPVLLG